MLSIEDLRARPTISVEEAGPVLGLGRTATYQAVNRGDIPSVRVGKRIRVPSAPLLRMLGADASPALEVAGP